MILKVFSNLNDFMILPFFWSVFPTPNGMHGGGCLGGAERTDVADTVLVHVLGITLRGEAVCHGVPTGLSPSRGPSACTADTSPRSCVQPCRMSPSLCQCASAGPREDRRPQVISREVCEVAGLPPQAWHTDSPAVCLVPFQTTLTLLIKGVPTV